MDRERDPPERPLEPRETLPADRPGLLREKLRDGDELRDRLEVPDRDEDDRLEGRRDAPLLRLPLRDGLPDQVGALRVGLVRERLDETSPVERRERLGVADRAGVRLVGRREAPLLRDEVPRDVPKPGRRGLL